MKTKIFICLFLLVNSTFASEVKEKPDNQKQIKAEDCLNIEKTSPDSNYYDCLDGVSNSDNDGEKYWQNTTEQDLETPEAQQDIINLMPEQRIRG